MDGHPDLAGDHDATAISFRSPRRSRPRARSTRPPRKPAAIGRVLAELAAEAPPLDPELAAALANRPRTRGDCIDGPRPCPWYGCRHSLLLEVNPVTGSIKLNHADLADEELLDSCALDVADRGPQELRAIGDRLNVTHQGARIIEQRALVKLRESRGLA